MDPLLITVDLLFAVIGLFVVWIAWRLHSKGEIPHKTAVPVFLLGGVLLMVGVTMTPSRILPSITSNEVENQTSQQMVAQDDDGPDDLTVVDGGPKGKTIIITDDEDLKNLLRQAIAKLPEATKEISTNSDISTELLNVNGTDDDDSSGDDDSTTEDDDSGDDDSAQVDERRDPFKVAVLVQESEPVVMTPVMTHPRARIRTLPKEPVSGATPLCTDFKLLHGQAGGPEPGGCHVVGCSQGYALPMQHLPSGGWGQCDSVNRVERIDQCYVVPDADGTERGRTFSEDGSWVDCPVS